MDSILVFSHLRWDFVYQRPQHLLSRLAKHYHIIFFEEPVFQQGDPQLIVSSPLTNLTVCRPATPVNKPGYDDEQIPYLRNMVKDIVEEHDPSIVWFYTPMALPLMDGVDTGCIVYDCMDELSLFKNPPPSLLEREQALLDKADIVFTGGPSLYKAKKDRHPNVHCFSSSVDASHFRQALNRNIAHAQQSTLPHPRLGFYGVIDERFDTQLVSDIADAHPDWQIVLVGPVSGKIEPESLPRQPNIHYMGQQSYNDLPKFLAAWDVCIMPFAINDSTRFISPTKSLEYMAAELPIVSTPVTDVVDAHSDVVEIGATSAEFISACEKVLNMSDTAMLARIRAMREKLSRTSWDATAESMRSLMQGVLESRQDAMLAQSPLALKNAAMSNAAASRGGQTKYRE
jgi:glycosyltransferase involved in cell wall biosynthesis